MSKSKTPIYRIKVTLRNVAPPVWRRIDDRIETRAAGQGWPVCGFGDGWEHELKIEKAFPPEPGCATHAASPPAVSPVEPPARVT